MIIETLTYASDFETTVYEGQDHTEVWSSAHAQIGGDQILVHKSLEETMMWLERQTKNVILYYHNLKFDGHFWVDFLLRNGYQFCRDIRKKWKGWFTATISEMGSWYIIKFKTGKITVEIRDSYKLLPFSLDRISKSFKTKHKKLELQYEGYRYAGGEITNEEMQYIVNDVLVLKEALEIAFDMGGNKLTIGSCCIEKLKELMPNFKVYFEDLKELQLNEEIYGDKNVDYYIRRTYRGGWCYLNPKHANKEKISGQTYDVNSLYPSVMHGESGNYYPIGSPKFFTKEIPEFLMNELDKVWFVRFKCRFELKEGYLPTVQIKRSLFYKASKYLTTSKIEWNGNYYDTIEWQGKQIDSKPTISMTMVDYKMFLEHYDVTELDILDGCYFNGKKGIFDEYIDYFKELKIKSTGALREWAKLYLNNCYGKLASSDDSSYKEPYLLDDILHFDRVSEQEKKTISIAAGAMVTAYARYFTITACQKNYDLFVYSDTDSAHLLKGEIKDMPIHNNNFNCWKHESDWDNSIFVRAKTYIEHITHEEGTEVEPYWNLKCAGMNEKCKDYFIRSMTGEKPKEEELKEMKPEVIDFISQKRKLTDFKPGLKIFGKLRPKRIKGGLVLEEGYFTLKN